MNPFLPLAIVPKKKTPVELFFSCTSDALFVLLFFLQAPIFFWFHKKKRIYVACSRYVYFPFRRQTGKERSSIKHNRVCVAAQRGSRKQPSLNKHEEREIFDSLSSITLERVQGAPSKWKTVIFRLFKREKGEGGDSVVKSTFFSLPLDARLLSERQHREKNSMLARKSSNLIASRVYLLLSPFPTSIIVAIFIIAASQASDDKWCTCSLDVYRGFSSAD